MRLHNFIYFFFLAFEGLHLFSGVSCYGEECSNLGKTWHIDRITSRNKNELQTHKKVLLIITKPQPQAQPQDRPGRRLKREL